MRAVRAVAGKEHVRKHFLTPRYLRDYLKGVALFQDVLEEFALTPGPTDLSQERLEK